jgi:hypothetical protein
MTNKQLCRLQTLMLADEVRKLTDKEKAEFDALWALVEAQERRNNQ